MERKRSGHHADGRNAHERGYNSVWKRATLRFKDDHPYCLGCRAIGLVRATSCIDHIIPHRGDKTLFWNEENWQPSCSWHHNSIKPMLEKLWTTGILRDSGLRLDSPVAVRLSKGKHRPAIGVDGFTIAGT